MTGKGGGGVLKNLLLWKVSKWSVGVEGLRGVSQENLKTDVEIKSF